MSAQTLGPWRIRACGCCCEDESRAIVASRTDNLDIIAQIVREHNAHAELVAALRSMAHADGCWCDAAFAMPGDSRHEHSPECKSARAALAKAGAA